VAAGVLVAMAAFSGPANSIPGTGWRSGSYGGRLRQKTATAEKIDAIPTRELA
jgi:hypothetical protein